jgi:type II secretory pathway pseudopilin PulG
MRSKCSRRAGGQAGDTPAPTPGYTIVELLIVMTIILVLVGLILATSGYVHNKGARSRAEAEIAAMSAALENYKADNGVYPLDASVDAKTESDPANYKNASLTLYKAISGDANNDANRSAELISYMSFKPNQLAPTDTSQKVDFIKDPFGNSYGYSTIYQTDPAKGYNPTFDLWSTANYSPPSSPTPTPTPQTFWIKNW